MINFKMGDEFTSLGFLTAIAYSEGMFCPRKLSLFLILIYSPVIYMKLELNSILSVFPYNFNISFFTINFQRFSQAGFSVPTGPVVEVEKISALSSFFLTAKHQGRNKPVYIK